MTKLDECIMVLDFHRRTDSLGDRPRRRDGSNPDASSVALDLHVHASCASLTESQNPQA